MLNEPSQRAKRAHYSGPRRTFNAVMSIQYPLIRLRNPETGKIAEL